MMEISGHTTHIAYDGPSAIEMARKLHPDVCISRYWPSRDEWL